MTSNLALTASEDWFFKVIDYLRAHNLESMTIAIISQEGNGIVVSERIKITAKPRVDHSN